MFDDCKITQSYWLQGIKCLNSNLIMKKLIIISSVLLLSLSSCAKRYTCPTYLQDNPATEDVRVSNDAPQDQAGQKMEESND